MPSTNITVPEMFDSCPLMGPYAWRDEYLTHAVYLNLVISTIINGITFPFIILFNGLLIFFIIRRPTLRRKKSAVVIGYQAVTDLAVGVIVQPIFMATQLCRITGQCRICVADSIFFYLLVVTCGSSIFHLTLIAWERYVAIKHGLRYRLIVTTNRLLIGTTVIWLLNFVLHGMFLFGLGPVIYDFVVTIALLISIALIVYFYTAIYLESRRHQDQINATASQHGTNLSRKKEFKAAKTTALVIGCLLTCYAPTVLVLVTGQFVPVNSSNRSLWECIAAWQYTIVMLNSLLNPLIYGYRVQEIRELFASTFKWRANNAGVEMIEMVELNFPGRVNLGFERNDEEFVTGGLASCPCPLGNPSQVTELRSTDNRETSIFSNAEANKERGCISKPTAHTSQTFKNDDVDSESDFEQDTRF